MKWTDTGILLSQKQLGERGGVLGVLTETHGLCKGLARHSKGKPLPQPGTLAHVTWTGRLAEQLGSWSLEPTFQPMALLLDKPLNLNALNAACSLIEVTLPEGEKAPEAYHSLKTLLYALDEEDWQRAYVTFERALLKLMGYELVLDKCAATGSSQDLHYISPKSGRAVSRVAGEPHKDKLFPLSAAFVSESFDVNDFLDSLKALSFFWETYVLQPHGTRLPPARNHFLNSIARRAL